MYTLKWRGEANIITYTERRELEPEDEKSLEGEVPGKVVEDDTKSEAFEEVEEAKNDPVCEPLDIISRTGRFDSLDGEIGGENPTEKI